MAEMKTYIQKYLFHIFIFTLTGCEAFAQDTEKPLIDLKDVEQLKDLILNLPKLGTTGIILFIVAIIVAFGVWWWWKGYAKKIMHKENEKQRRRDQAENKTENQDMTDDWDEANKTVEDIRKAGDNQPKKPRPKPPGNS